MRGIGSLGGFLGLSAMGDLGGIGGGFEYNSLFGYRSPRARRTRQATGWQDRPFEHPEGKCDYKPTGSKRSRRRAAAQSQGRKK